MSFPHRTDFSKPRFLPRVKCAQRKALPGGCAAPGGPMLAFVPVTLDLYRTVRRHLHWTLQNLVAFADRTGKCFPSVRTLAAATGQPRSTVSRHLAQVGPGGRHRTSAAPWRLLRLHCRDPLPAGAARGVPSARSGCPTDANRRTDRYVEGGPNSGHSAATECKSSSTDDRKANEL